MGSAIYLMELEIGCSAPRQDQDMDKKKDMGQAAPAGEEPAPDETVH